MKFFVPALNPSLAEQLWAYTRQHLSGLGLDTSRRRIWALAWRGEGEEHFLAIGDDLPNGEDGPVMVILESRDLDLFYVCTPDRGLLDDIPYPITLDDEWRVIDFEGEIYGLA